MRQVSNVDSEASKERLTSEDFTHFIVPSIRHLMQDSVPVDLLLERAICLNEIDDTWRDKARYNIFATFRIPSMSLGNKVENVCEVKTKQHCQYNHRFFHSFRHCDKVVVLHDFVCILDGILSNEARD